MFFLICLEVFPPSYVRTERLLFLLNEITLLFINFIIFTSIKNYINNSQ